MADENPAREPALEIQFHPAGIRRGVGYLFLTRRHLRLVAVLGGAILCLVVFGLVVTPSAVANRFRLARYRQLVEERSHQGRRLEQLTSELEQLASRGEELHLQTGRILLTYGLNSEDSIGQGGFPFSTAEPIVTIYSDSVQHGQGMRAQVSERVAVLGTFLDELETFESAHDEQVRVTPSVCPLPEREFVLTSPFGRRRSPFTKQIDSHPGLDLAATQGTEIRSPADAVVVFAGRYPSRQSVSWWRYGNLVALAHGERFITLFGHCDEILVKSGQQVGQGEVIATVGNSGWSTSPHLHYEVRRKNDEDGRFMPVDPRIYILDHRWRNEEQMLIRARQAPDLSNFEPLPRLIAR